MKKTVQDFGSHWDRPASRVRGEEPAETTCESGADYLGFRLVHDGAHRVNRGGSWGNAAVGARAASRGGDHPGDRGGSLGLRLVYDREDT